MSKIPPDGTPVPDDSALDVTLSFMAVASLVVIALVTWGFIRLML